MRRLAGDVQRGVGDIAGLGDDLTKFAGETLDPFFIVFLAERPQRARRRRQRKVRHGLRRRFTADHVSPAKCVDAEHNDIPDTVGFFALNAHQIEDRLSVRPGLHLARRHGRARAHIRTGPFHAPLWVDIGKRRRGLLRLRAPGGDKRASGEPVRKRGFEIAQGFASPHRRHQSGERIGEFCFIVDLPERHGVPDMEVAQNLVHRPVLEQSRAR